MRTASRLLSINGTRRGVYSTNHLPQLDSSLSPSLSLPHAQSCSQPSRCHFLPRPPNVGLCRRLQGLVGGATWASNSTSENKKTRRKKSNISSSLSPPHPSPIHHPPRLSQPSAGLSSPVGVCDSNHKTHKLGLDLKAPLSSPVGPSPQGVAPALRCCTVVPHVSRPRGLSAVALVSELLAHVREEEKKKKKNHRGGAELGKQAKFKGIRSGTRRHKEACRRTIDWLHPSRRGPFAYPVYTNVHLYSVESFSEIAASEVMGWLPRGRHSRI